MRVNNQIDLLFKSFKHGKRSPFSRKLMDFFKSNYASNKMAASQETFKIVSHAASCVKLKKSKKRSVLNYTAVYNSGSRKKQQLSIKVFLKSLSNKIGLVASFSKGSSGISSAKKNTWKKSLYKAANGSIN